MSASLSALLISALAMLVVGCGQTEEVVQDPYAEDWAWLQENKTALDGKRQELTDAKYQLANPVDPEAEADARDIIGEVPTEGAGD